MERNIWDFLDLLKSRGFNVVKLDNIGKEYDITRIAYNTYDTTIAYVKGSRYPIYTNILNDRKKLYLALNVDTDIDAYKKIKYSIDNPSKPREDNFNMYFEESNDLLDKIPFIKYYKEDGGFYLTSAIYCACMDGVCNSSYHRTMYMDPYRATLRIVPRHLYRMYNESLKRNKELPVAVILGVHPVIELAASLSPPYGVYEIFIAHSLLPNSFKIVQTPLYRIPIPSTASIVLEGVISKDVDWEGPFVDILRIPDKRRKQPIFKLEKVYVNKQFDPMVHAIVPGLNEHILLMGFPREVFIWDTVSRVADVKAVRLTPGSGGWLTAVISIRKRVEGEGKNVILAAFTGHPSLKTVIVVDDDINIDDYSEIDWAISTRFQASKDLVIIGSAKGSTLDPSGNEGVGDKIGIDATCPLNCPRELFKRVEIP